MRQPPCKWLERDSEGRPRCEHGWARKNGNGWWCRMKQDESVRRYENTDKGREMRRKVNAAPATRSRKELHELTRVRIS